MELQIQDLVTSIRKEGIEAANAEVPEDDRLSVTMIGYIAGRVEKQCMELGCPAISMKNKKAHIDFTQCVGCDVCTQLCKLNAIEKGER